MLWVKFACAIPVQVFSLLVVRVSFVCAPTTCSNRTRTDDFVLLLFFDCFATGLHRAIRGLKVPHMGWNELVIDVPHPVYNGLSSGDHAYCLHFVVGRRDFVA